MRHLLHMKKLISTLSLVALLSPVACGKKGGNSALISRSELTGCWTLVQALIGTPQGKLVVTEEYPDYYTFDQNGFLYRQTAGGDQETTKWNLVDGGTALELPGQDFLVQQWDGQMLEISDSDVVVPSGIEGRLELQLTPSSDCPAPRAEAHRVAAEVQYYPPVGFTSDDATAIVADSNTWSVSASEAKSMEEVVTITIAKEQGRDKITYTVTDFSTGQIVEYPVTQAVIDAEDTGAAIRGAFSCLVTEPRDLSVAIPVLGNFLIDKSNAL
jgi:hypothetical protein